MSLSTTTRCWQTRTPRVIPSQFTRPYHINHDGRNAHRKEESERAMGWLYKYTRFFDFKTVFRNRYKPLDEKRREAMTKANIPLEPMKLKSELHPLLLKYPELRDSAIRHAVCRDYFAECDRLKLSPMAKVDLNNLKASHSKIETYVRLRLKYLIILEITSEAGKLPGNFDWETQYRQCWLWSIQKISSEEYKSECETILQRFPDLSTPEQRKKHINHDNKTDESEKDEEFRLKILAARFLHKGHATEEGLETWKRDLEQGLQAMEKAMLVEYEEALTRHPEFEDPVILKQFSVEFKTITRNLVSSHRNHINDLAGEKLEALLELQLDSLDALAIVDRGSWQAYRERREGRIDVGKSLEKLREKMEEERKARNTWIWDKGDD